MKSKKQFMENLRTILEKGKGQVIEDTYIKLIIDSFSDLIEDEAEINEDMLTEIIDIIDAVIERALNCTDQSKVAAMLMARLSGAKHLTIAHTNIVLTTIGLTFKCGNQILYNISKYNSHINNICLEQMNVLAQLSDNRKQAQLDTTKKQEDINNVANIIKQQFAAL